MSLVHPVAKARGRGSAKSGVHHWWVQRLTAVALVPLTLWVVYSLVRMSGSSHEDVLIWMGNPINAALLIAFIVTALNHAQLGLQVVVEDYVHSPGTEFALLIIIKLLAAFGAIVAVISVLRVLFGG